MQTFHHLINTNSEDIAVSEQPGLFDTMYSCRAMRRLKTDPVPEDDILQLIDAANQAPTGSNQQGARWIVVRDPEQRRALADLNRSAVEAYIGPASGRPAALPNQDTDKRSRMLNAVLWQAEHMHEIPVLIVACYEFDGPIGEGAPSGGGGSIWPAVQNLLLAARALGLGAAPTTLGLSNPGAVRKTLNLPDNMAAYCLIPVGYPLGKFGPLTRLPVAETMRWDRWA